VEVYLEVSSVAEVALNQATINLVTITNQATTTNQATAKTMVKVVKWVNHLQTVVTDNQMHNYVEDLRQHHHVVQEDIVQDIL
jgi:hypothetical protein